MVDVVCSKGSPNVWYGHIAPRKLKTRNFLCWSLGDLFARQDSFYQIMDHGSLG